MTRELEGREEAIHRYYMINITTLTTVPRLKEKMKLHETKLKKLGMMEAKIHQMEKGPH
jgi:hypothetical protein